MQDPTEKTRRAIATAINAEPGSREDLEQKHGQVYDTKEFQKEFQLHAFAAPFISCSRRSDGAKGVMMFQHNPRFYWGFEEMT